MVDERFCNSFAGNLLVPAETLRSDLDAQRLAGMDNPGSHPLLSTLANKYRVSRQVMWYRLFELSFITSKQYREKWAEWAAQSKKPKKAAKSAPKRSAAAKSVSENGLTFIAEVLEAYDRQLVGLNDAVDWLAIHTKDVPKLQAALERGSSDGDS